MAALIIGLVMNVAHGSVDYWAVNARRQWQRSFLHRKINKKALAGEGFEPATFSVTGEHATH
jgi:hypothetical protein